jgi:hypothetical protein
LTQKQQEPSSQLIDAKTVVAMLALIVSVFSLTWQISDKIISRSERVLLVPSGYTYETAKVDTKPSLGSFGETPGTAATRGITQTRGISLEYQILNLGENSVYPRDLEPKYLFVNDPTFHDELKPGAFRTIKTIPFPLDENVTLPGLLNLNTGEPTVTLVTTRGQYIYNNLRILAQITAQRNVETQIRKNIQDTFKNFQ